MGNHALCLDEISENIWSLNFSKNKWGYQKFSQWVCDKLSELDIKNLSIKDLKDKIKSEEEKDKKINESISELKDILESKEKSEEEKFILSNEECWWLLDAKKDLKERPEFFDGKKNNYLNKFNKEFELSKKEFTKIMNLAKKQVGVV